jgi:hypothetical protein
MEKEIKVMGREIKRSAKRLPIKEELVTFRSEDVVMNILTGQIYILIDILCNTENGSIWYAKGEKSSNKYVGDTYMVSTTYLFKLGEFNE